MADTHGRILVVEDEAEIRRVPASMHTR